MGAVEELPVSFMADLPKLNSGTQTPFTVPILISRGSPGEGGFGTVTRYWNIDMYWKVLCDSSGQKRCWGQKHPSHDR